MPGPKEDKKLELLNRILKEKCDYPGILEAGRCVPGTTIEFRLNRYSTKSLYQIHFTVCGENEMTEWDNVDIDCITKIHNELPKCLKAHLVHYNYRIGNIDFNKSISLSVLEQALGVKRTPWQMFVACLTKQQEDVSAPVMKR